MAENQRQAGNQNPDRWNGFVFIAWAIAIITWLFGIYILMEAGTTHMPYGGGSSLNIGVWAWVIGQSLGVLLIAGLFSMLNSIYKNTCKPPALSENQDKKVVDPGYELVSAPPGSPFYSKASKGFVIKTVNGSPVASHAEVNANAKIGSNAIVVAYPGGQTSKININSDDGILIP